MMNRALRSPALRQLPFTTTRSFTSSTRALKVYENVTASQFSLRCLQPTGADAETPVLVDFFATWCQPCKLLSPTLHKVATSPEVVGGKEVDLVTIDVDQHQDIAAQFKVSTPSHEVRRKR